jgi:dienelactone hydrolase
MKTNTELVESAMNMKRHLLELMVVPVGLSALTILAGCGGGASRPPIAVSVSPTSAVDFSAFAATVNNDPANLGVTWSVTCPTSACGSVSPTSTPSGTATSYTPPSVPPAKDLTVTLVATSVADATKSASAIVSVPAITISVSPQTAAIQINTTLQLSATVNNDYTNGNVNWTLTQNGNACSPGCGSLSTTSTTSGAGPIYTAPTTLPTNELTLTLTATSTVDATKSAAATVTVPSVAISLTPPTATLIGTATTQLTASVVGDSSNKGVTWSVSCSPAPCGRVSPTSTLSGAVTTYTAPGPPPNDLQVAVTAASVADPLAVTSATITVSAITVDVAPSSATVPAGSTQQLTGTVGNDPTNKGVTWAVSCSATDCGSISPASTTSGGSATYTAPTTPPASDLTVAVTATSVTDTTKATSATMTIPAIKVSSVSPSSAIVPINASQDFAASVSYDPSNAGLNWTLTQNGTTCSPACGTVSPTSTPSGSPTTYTGPATAPANPSVTLNAIAAADTTKSSTVTITLTTGSVKLVPANLAFSCKISGRIGTVRCPPPVQTIVLTNTGSSALAINSISTTGANAALFSQTNDCGTSVGSAANCTVSVKFQPSIAGTYSANVSFNDGSTDSPQQVALSGKATTITHTNAAAARSELSSMATAVVPAPTGFATVGTRVIHLTDLTREDPYVKQGARRELAVRLWYPASLKSNQTCTAANYVSPAVWQYFSQIVGVPTFPVKTNSCLDAPFEDGSHPVVVFSPGFTASFTDYTFLTEDLASRGYIVASVAHTYETTAVELGNGQIAKSVLGSHLGGVMARDERSLSTAAYTRLQDVQFVVRELERLNIQRGSALRNKLDLSRIAVAGHSLGGLTALLSIQLEPRFKAAILMDGFVPSALPSATTKPVLLLGAGRDHWEPTECRLWSNLEGPRLAVNLRGTEHVALGDWIWLTRDSIQAGPMGPDRTLAAVRGYIAAFLDANLRNEAPRQLLTGSSSEYPGAEITTQNDALCHMR